MIPDDTRPIGSQPGSVQTTEILLIERGFQVLQPKLVTVSGKDIALCFSSVIIK